MRWLPALLMIGLVLAGCTAPESDNDGDTVPNGAERVGWNVVVDLIDRRISYHVDSDQDDFDTDDDGLSDYDEFVRGLDPRNPDTDQDGLSDCQEAVHSNRSECEDPGYAGEDDGGTGTDPLNADSDPGRSQYAARQPFTDETGTLPLGRPTTGDGVPDGDEVNGRWAELQLGRRFVTLDPRSADSDGDFLDDGAELFIAGSDPTVVDTDGDGCQDGLDPYPNTVERYSAGLLNITLDRDADVNIRAHVVDASRFHPAQGETVSAEAGEAIDLRAFSESTVSAGRCTYSIWDPWTYIEVLVHEDVGGQYQILDFYSETDTERSNVPRIWWNVREDVLSWTRDGAPVEVPIRFAGEDGSLLLDPYVETP